MRYLPLILLLACSNKHSITGPPDKPPVDCKRHHHDHHDHDDNDKNKMEMQR